MWLVCPESQQDELRQRTDIILKPECRATFSKSVFALFAQANSDFLPWQPGCLRNIKLKR
jgi:hypothetical protein